jgi:hypothetical protein
MTLDHIVTMTLDTILMSTFEIIPLLHLLFPWFPDDVIARYVT